MGSDWRRSEFTLSHFSDEWGDSIMSATMNDYIQQETITGVVPMNEWRSVSIRSGIYFCLLVDLRLRHGVIRKERMWRNI